MQWTASGLGDAIGAIRGAIAQAGLFSCRAYAVGVYAALEASICLISVHFRCMVAEILRFVSSLQARPVMALAIFLRVSAVCFRFDMVLGSLGLASQYSI